MSDDNLILVGFGNHDLTDMVTWIGDEEKEESLLNAVVEWIPRYRKYESCSEEELGAFETYISWLQRIVEEYERVSGGINV